MSRQVRSRIRGGARLLRATVDTGLRAGLTVLAVALVAVAAGFWTARDGATTQARDVASTQSGPEVGASASTGLSSGPAGDPGASSGPASVEVPTAPTGLRAQPGNATADLCWVASPDVDNYTLFHRDVTAGQGWMRMPFPIEKPCYPAKELVNGHTYEFRLTGSNRAGESDPSNTVTVEPMAPAPSTAPDRSTSGPERTTLSAPPAPSGLRAEPGDATVQLRWAATSGVDNYTLFHRDVTAGQDWIRMPFPIPKPSYTADQLVNGHTYEFRLTGSNRAGESGFSSTIAATPRKPVPAAPSGVAATPRNAEANLCWMASPGADAYTLYYRDVTAGQVRQRMPFAVNGTCYLAKQLVNGHTYEFWLTASNSSGESGLSTPVTVTPRS
ncbi:hypothetical protein CcI49_09085 [Frankia sp. CcI49]|nr:hypothetical protein CcI49_09085 [Frankia sp. CcI49]